MRAPARILIVDDDPTAILILQNALEGLGETRTASGGAEALAQVEKGGIDLVLLDALMPSLDGFTTCGLLQKDHPELPVIFVTVVSDYASEVRALDAGAVDFISKPIDPFAFVDQVAAYLAGKRDRLEESREGLALQEEGAFLLQELLGAMLAVWLQDFHSPFYRAPRVARGGGDFTMMKIRSMVVNAANSGVSSTGADDRRITAVGRFIRRWKVDELSQFLNVLAGSMSVVGPRPQVRAWGADLATPTGRKITWPWLRQTDRRIDAAFLRSCDMSRARMTIHAAATRRVMWFSVRWRSWREALVQC